VQGLWETYPTKKRKKAGAEQCQAQAKLYLLDS
jgi:hypothetical protein